MFSPLNDFRTQLRLIQYEFHINGSSVKRDHLQTQQTSSMSILLIEAS